MEITTTTTTQNPRRQAAVNALAIVGFIVLIIIGIVLAVYAVKFIPNAFDGSASAISSVFKSGDDQEPKLDVIDSSGAISFEPIATTTDPDDSDEDTDKDAIVADDSKNTGAKNTTTTTRTTTRTVQVPVTASPPAPFGNPDLTARITATGYCTSDNPDSFRTADTITGTKNGGVRFYIKNIGTNVARDWDFSYKVPSALSEQIVRNQHTLNPGDEIDYTLCFEKPKVGDNREIRIEADPGEDLRESNENNNVATAQVDIERR